MRATWTWPQQFLVRSHTFAHAAKQTNRIHSSIGSGPAYIFLTMEAMIDAAVHMGFPRETAKKLVLSTIRGSASYAQVIYVSINNYLIIKYSQVVDELYKSI